MSKNQNGVSIGFSSHFSSQNFFLLNHPPEIGSQSPRLFYIAAAALDTSDPVGVLLPEFVLCVTLIHLENPQLLTQVQMTPLTMWLHSIDNFNKLAPGVDKEDADDMLWPGMNKYHRTASAQMPSGEIGSKDEGKDAMWIRKADLENHNKDGGTWIVVGGKVYDVKDFRPNRSHHASESNGGVGGGGVATDAFEELTSGTDQSALASQQQITDTSSLFQDTEQAQEMLKSFFVGNFLEPDGGNGHPPAIEAHCPFPDLPNFSSPFMDLERNLAAFLGLHSNSLFHSTPLQPEELNCSRWTMSAVLKGGLKTIVERDPFDETKGEILVPSPAAAAENSPSSQPPTPMVASAASDTAVSAGLTVTSATSTGCTDASIRTDGSALLKNLADGNLSDPGLKEFIALSQRLSREEHLTFQMNFPPEHPVEEAGRILFALLLKFQGLESYLGQVIDAEVERRSEGLGNSMIGGFRAVPRPLIETLKTVHHTKWKLIKMRQEQGKSYKEVCTQVAEKCRFLLNEIRPHCESTINKVPLLRKQANFKAFVRDLLRKKRESQISSLLRPEDLLNVSIQSQDAFAHEQQQQHLQQQQQKDPCEGSQRESPQQPETNSTTVHFQANPEVDSSPDERAMDADDDGCGDAVPSSISVASGSSSSSSSSSETCESNANDNVAAAAAVAEHVESDVAHSEEEEEEEEDVDDEAKDEDSKRHDRGRQKMRDEEPSDAAEDGGRRGRHISQTESVEDNLVELEVQRSPQPPQNLSVDTELLNPPSRPNSSRGSISGLVPESRTAAEEDDFPGAVLEAAESQQLIQELVEFVVGDGETSVSIGELRQVLDEQIGRARRRMRGIEQINELLRSSIGSKFNFKRLAILYILVFSQSK